MFLSVSTLCSQTKQRLTDVDIVDEAFKFVLFISFKYMVQV